MELWIRSQDKETLIKTENISIDSENYIIGNLISDDNKSICDYWRLGHYKTKERALEVLDEIQSILNLKDMYKYDRELVLKSWENANEEQVKTVRQQMNVYKMPKE